MASDPVDQHANGRQVGGFYQTWPCAARIVLTMKHGEVEVVSRGGGMTPRAALEMAVGSMGQAAVQLESDQPAVAEAPDGPR